MKCAFACTSVWVTCRPPTPTSPPARALQARHVETYSRLLHEKFDLAYPITPTLKRLLDDVLSDSRWDMTYLGMQVLIEGLALAAFATIRDQAKNSLAAAVK